LYSPLWPQESVRDEMRPLLARQLHEGRAAALYLSELLASPPVREAAGQSDDQQSAKSQGSGSGEPTSDPSLNSDAQPDSQEVYRTRQEQQLITAIESMDRHLYEVAAIHAVYAQRDRNHDRIHNDGLREAIKEIFQEESLGPSLRQLVTCAAVLFIGYCTAITTLNHGMMAAMPVNAWTTGISAAYDTLRTMCVFVFTGLLAIYMTALDPQNELPQPSIVANAMTAALWAGLASLVLMIMVGMTYTWLIARSSEHFQILLFGDIRANGSMQPLLIWFLSYTPISAAIAVGIVLSRSLRWDIGHYLAVFLVALLGATLVVLHGGVLEDRYPACFGQADAPDGRGSSPCWENIVDGLAAKFTDMMAALISILFLSQSGQAGRARTRNSARKNRGTGRRFRRLSRFF
ncbi:hypothetical protein QSV04_10770, partial [Bifidobacterium longum]|uniref:hypothetical protein n=1 Tax=Bifidobacterium longum TaxID=216816 RepID=UPI00257060F3